MVHQIQDRCIITTGLLQVPLLGLNTVVIIVQATAKLLVEVQLVINIAAKTRERTRKTEEQVMLGDDQWALSRAQQILDLLSCSH